MDAKQNFFDLHIQFFEIFKSQDPESIHLDIAFEIGGKKLYANKAKLCIISPTFESMLSERWTSKNESIQIKDYKYENFKEFLTFIYSGECSLNDENVFIMIDMAEFYGVQVFKAACTRFLKEMEYSMENVLTILETSNKYSLVEVKTSLQIFIAHNFNAIVKSERFLNTRKEIVEELVICVLNVIKPEELFQGVYEWVEHQVKQKNEVNDLNLNETIKAEITQFLPYIEFKKMGISFFALYVGFIFSYDELSEIMNNALENMSADVKVKLTNSNGQSISGYLRGDSDAVKVIKTLKNVKPAYFDADVICWNTECKRPSTPSQIKKIDGVIWYLIYDCDGYIAVRHFTEIYDSCYLLAEMIAESSSRFVPTPNCKIERN